MICERRKYIEKLYKYQLSSEMKYSDREGESEPGNPDGEEQIRV